MATDAALPKVVLRATAVGLASVLPFAWYLATAEAQDPSEPEEALLAGIFLSPLVLTIIAVFGLALASGLGLRPAWPTALLAPVLLAAGAVFVSAVSVVIGIDTAGGWEAGVGWMAIAVAGYPVVTLLFLDVPVRTRLVAVAVIVAMTAGMLAFVRLSQHRYRLDYYRKTLVEPVIVPDVPGFQPLYADYGWYTATWGLRWVLVGKQGWPFHGRVAVIDVFRWDGPGCRQPQEIAPGRYVCVGTSDVELYVDGGTFEVSLDEKLVPTDIRQHVLTQSRTRRIALEELAALPRSRLGV